MRVFGKTLSHEFLISYSLTERYFIFSVFSDSATTRAQKRILCKMEILGKPLVTLYKQN